MEQIAIDFEAPPKKGRKSAPVSNVSERHREIVRLGMQHEDIFLSGFLTWLEENECVFALFCRLADALWARGRRHYSSRAIWEKMRYDHDISDNTEPFKVSDRAIPDAARMYVLMHPGRVGLFSYRETSTRENFIEYVEKMLSDARAAPDSDMDAHSGG